MINSQNRNNKSILKKSSSETKDMNRKEPGQNSNKVLYVYDKLQDAILNHSFRPGERLNISKCSKSLNVSVSPVRESLRLLEANGFVKYIPHIGYIVSELTIEEIKSLFMIRGSLTSLAAKPACKNITKSNLQNLAAMVSKMKLAIEKGDINLWADTNNSFHALIAEISGLPLLRSMIINLQEKSKLIRQYPRAVIMRGPQANKEHSKILSALKARNADLLEELLRNHELSAGESYAKYVVKYKKQEI